MHGFESETVFENSRKSLQASSGEREIGQRPLISRGKFHCSNDLLFDWFAFDQTSKADANSTNSKQLKPNKINRRSAIPSSYTK